MPFKSQAQRRKFYALKAKGQMDQKTIDEWNKDTPKDIPEKLAFWDGFHKQAWLTTGAGKGILERAGRESSRDAEEGVADADGNSAAEDATQLLDRERNPRSFKPFDPGLPDFEQEDGSHVKY